MKKLKLTSHYNKTSLNIMVDPANAVQILGAEDPISLINEDIDRVRYGYAPLYISPGQARRIGGWLPGTDYFDKIEEAK